MLFVVDFIEADLSTKTHIQIHCNPALQHYYTSLNDIVFYGYMVRNDGVFHQYLSHSAHFNRQSYGTLRK